ncbi:hypothetical protein HispidOSU_022485 [Sigmodon hispidus]
MDVVRVLEGKLFHNVVVVLENPVEVPVEVVSLAVLGALEETVHKVVSGFLECGSFDVWRRLVGEAESVERLEAGKLSVVRAVLMETVLSEEVLLNVVTGVEDTGSLDGHLLVDMETVLADPGVAIEVEDSGPVV